MREDIDSKEYRLHPRTVLEKIDSKTIAIVINRKSRIIMGDGKKILDKARKIKNIEPGFKGRT